uniref:Uncharacterized protein n=1 Tax=Aegilops tauschii subsp. strangulata TaxID=200361 RepID=A0A453IZZ2_AEGTS
GRVRAGLGGGSPRLLTVEQTFAISVGVMHADPTNGVLKISLR